MNELEVGAVLEDHECVRGLPAGVSPSWRYPVTIAPSAPFQHWLKRRSKGTNVNPKSWNAFTLSSSVPEGVMWTMWSRIFVDGLAMVPDSDPSSEGQ